MLSSYKIAVLLTIQVTCFVVYYNFENRNRKNEIPMIVLWILLLGCFRVPFTCRFEGLFGSSL